MMGSYPELETTVLHGSRKQHGMRNWNVRCPWRDHCLKRSNEEANIYKILITCYRGVGGKVTPGHVLHSKSRGAEESHCTQSPKVHLQGHYHLPTGLTSSLPALACAPLPTACGEPSPHRTFCISSFVKPWRLFTSGGNALLL